MTERLAAWGLALPLVLGGSQVAHWLAYLLVTPSAPARREELAATGHGYLQHAPQAIAVAAALGACAFAARVASARARTRGRGPDRLGLLPLAALPVVAFAVQEHLERLLHDGAMPFGAALEPTFLIGLALQLPFALVAYGLARLLLRAAEAAASLARRPPPRPVAAVVAGRAPLSAVLVPGASPLALSLARRGPPRSSLA